jgi:hypothetical protein
MSKAGMMRILLLFCFLFFIKFSFGQIDSSDYKDHCLYLYKTEDDFFNKKSVYRGQYIESENKKEIKYKTANSKKKVLNLEDSCSYYYGYEVGGEIQIRPDKNPQNSTYYSFGGGTKDLYCVVYGTLGNYDKKGYLLGLTAPTNHFHIYFVDRVNKLYMVQLGEFLKSSPKLLGQYKAEKAKTKKETWERNNLVVAIKYLKLLIEERQ